MISSYLLLRVTCFLGGLEKLGHLFFSQRVSIFSIDLTGRKKKRPGPCFCFLFAKIFDQVVEEKDTYCVVSWVISMSRRAKGGSSGVGGSGHLREICCFGLASSYTSPR
jgi:hypothetical protein